MVTRLPILTFHALDDRSSIISFSPRLFRRGIARLHEHGYHTLTLLDAVDRLCVGAPWPDRSFVIAFDDGYQTVYEKAFPVLQDYGMSATIFLTVGAKGTVDSGDPQWPIYVGLAGYPGDAAVGDHLWRSYAHSPRLDPIVPRLGES